MSVVCECVRAIECVCVWGLNYSGGEGGRAWGVWGGGDELNTDLFISNFPGMMYI